MELIYYGHSCFALHHKDIMLLVDPFFTGNTWETAKADDITCNYIFVSHGHDDHYGDSDSIAVRNHALFISTPEVVSRAEKAGIAVKAMHLGGKGDFPFGTIRMVPAFHGAGVPGGHAAGALITFFGKTIYYAGDTCFFSDMGLLKHFGNIDYALLPIGDTYTMGVDDALLAASYIKAAVTVPVHYNTWPVIEADPFEFVARLEKEYGRKGLVIAPGAVKEL
jgi:UPF0173 metal-dependent hydrolase vpar_1330